jgi:Zn-dependent peptidase ImmA (M78 family)
MLKRIKDLVRGASVVVKPDDKMPYDEAYVDPATNTIFVRRSVMILLDQRNPRALWTLAHELGHLILRHPRVLSRAQNDLRANQPQVNRYEREAHLFAAALLAPSRLVEQCADFSELARRAGISLSAAKIRFEEHQEEQRRQLGIKREIPKSVQAFLRKRVSEGYSPRHVSKEDIEKFSLESEDAATAQGYLSKKCPQCGQRKLVRRAGNIFCECGWPPDSDGSTILF